MDIDKEVAKYEKKKKTLLNALIGRLQNFSTTKVVAINNITSTVTDLNKQKNVHQADLQKATMTVNELKGK